MVGNRSDVFTGDGFPRPEMMGQLTDVVFDVDDVVFELPPAVLEGEASRAM